MNNNFYSDLITPKKNESLSDDSLNKLITEICNKTSQKLGVKTGYKDSTLFYYYTLYGEKNNYNYSYNTEVFIIKINDEKIHRYNSKLKKGINTLTLTLNKVELSPPSKITTSDGNNDPLSAPEFITTESVMISLIFNESRTEVKLDHDPKHSNYATKPKTYAFTNSDSSAEELSSEIYILFENEFYSREREKSLK